MKFKYIYDVITALYILIYQCLVYKCKKYDSIVKCQWFLECSKEVIFTTSKYQYDNIGQEPDLRRGLWARLWTRTQEWLLRGWSSTATFRGRRTGFWSSSSLTPVWTKHTFCYIHGTRRLYKLRISMFDIISPYCCTDLNDIFSNFTCFVHSYKNIKNTGCVRLMMRWGFFFF